MKKQNVIGPAVHRLRQSASLPVEELAVRMARAGSTLSSKDIAAIESGNRRVKDRDVRHFARALGVCMKDLYPRRGRTD